MSLAGLKRPKLCNLRQEKAAAHAADTLVMAPADTVRIEPAHEPGAQVSERPAVACRGLVKEFGSGDARVQALRGVDWSVRAGQMTLLAGPSGCGKTTLISVVAGLLEPTAGEVEVFGEDLAKLRGSELVRFRGRNMGFVFQQYNLLPSLTSVQNAAIPLEIAGVPRREAHARAAELLTAVGLGSKLDALPRQLSGGQQQRVAIARALVHDPRMLVCDEPTAALDAESGRTVMELLRKVSVQPGRVVIVVTHDSRVFAYGDEIVEMSDGRIERIESRVGQTK
ncbi:MAG: ABC transporter ATP-binding protein [Pirellulales bacterium]